MLTPPKEHSKEDGRIQFEPKAPLQKNLTQSSSKPETDEFFS